MSWEAPSRLSPRATTPSLPISGGFGDLGLPKALVSALQSGGITEPFPIQAATIPDALAGRDVLGRGQTGSGKTLGFGLPMITNLSGSQRAVGTAPARPGAGADPRARDAGRRRARAAGALQGLSLTLVAGGMPYGPQLEAFERGVDIVVATPGRLIDLIDQGAADLTRVEVIVLDEADHMADMGFLPEVTQILDTVPAGGQRLLFSATLDGAVDRLVKRYLTDPVTHEVDRARPASLRWSTTCCTSARRTRPVTAEIAGRDGRTVVFVRTQRGADRVAEQLREAGVLAGALHGGLTQGARARMLAAFKDGRLPVLVATDVAARGIHVDDVGLVLQVDPPAGPKDYLHRAGRTARAGETGVVVTLALPHQRREVERLTRQAGVQALPLSTEPGDALMVAATGARVPNGPAVSQQEFDKLVAPPARTAKRRPGQGHRGRHDSRGGSAGRRPRY